MGTLNGASPMIKSRVLYIGSAVPIETTEGLEAIQAPLRNRYPVNDDSTLEGIDAMLSISNSCLQLQYLNDSGDIIQFPIGSLTLCAAVRCVSTINGSTGEGQARFVSLLDPAAGGQNAHRPAIFTAITRRTQGRKVLDCHGFVCQNPTDALNLVKVARIVGMNFKKNGSVMGTIHRAAEPVRTSGTLNGSVVANGGISGIHTSDGDYSFAERTTAAKIDGPAMRLVPGEPIRHNVTAGPEFFDPVPTQGYFYSTNNVEVKKYNILKEGKINAKPNSHSPNSTPGHTEGSLPTFPVNGTEQTTLPRQMPPKTVPPPIYVPLRMPPPRHMAPPMGFRPPMYYMPPPPHQFIMRPRFFSPPPPRFRPLPFGMPPGGPQPMYGPPIFERRPRAASRGSSRSKSRSSSESRGSHDSKESRSKTPTNQVNGHAETEPKRNIPNADESTDDSIHERPSTPPTDYNPRQKGERKSRRDEYEVRYGVERLPPFMMRPPPPGAYMDPYGRAPYDYYAYPPTHPPPFPMNMPHGRSRSLPPRRTTIQIAETQGQEKNKKQKKNKHRYEEERMAYPGPSPRRLIYGGYYPSHNDASRDSYTGYHSDMPARRQRPELSGYEFYPPRDFRRDENQFMNERQFSKSIARETGRSRDSKSYPTAYELNEALDRTAPKREDDFNLY